MGLQLSKLRVSAIPRYVALRLRGTDPRGHIMIGSGQSVPTYVTYLGIDAAHLVLRTGVRNTSEMGDGWLAYVYVYGVLEDVLLVVDWGGGELIGVSGIVWGRCGDLEALGGLGLGVCWRGG